MAYNFNFFKKPNTHLKIIEILNKANIESRPLWKPMHLQPAFKGVNAIIDGTSEDLFNRICLPSGTDLSDNDIDKFVRLLKKNL